MTIVQMGAQPAGDITHPNRRAFLKEMGALVVSFSVLGADGAAFAQGARPKDVSLDEIDSWIKVDAAGQVTLFSGKVELGQGIMTSFAQIAADELDVPITRMTVIQGDTTRTPDQGVSSA